MPRLSRDGLLSLPNELLVRILDEMNTFDLIACRELCRKIKHLVDNTSSCQYTIECALASVDPRHSGRYDVATSLARLRDWRVASVDLRKAATYDIPFVERFSETIVNRSIMAQVIPGHNGLLMTQLRSQSRGIPLKQWRLENINIPLHWHEVDQSQDLLIIVESTRENETLQSLKIHSLSMTTGAYHPLGLKEPVCAQLEAPQREPLQQSLGISGDHVAVMVFDDIGRLHSELWIWNWKTGERKLNIHGGLLNGSLMVASSFILMANNCVLLPLWIPTNSRGDRLSLRAVTYHTATAERKHYAEVSWVATFELPRLVRRVGILRIEAAGPSYAPCGASDDPPVPFECDPETRVFVFNIALVAEYHDRLQGFYLFAPAAAIEEHCRGGETAHVPWHALAPRVRMIHKQPFGLIGSGQVFHTRCIFPELDDSDEEEDENGVVVLGDGIHATPLVIFDFASKCSLRREMQLGRTDCEYVFEPTVLSLSSIWQETITTGALCPYRRINTPLRLRVRTGMYCLTEDAVILGEEIGECWHVWSY